MAEDEYKSRNSVCGDKTVTEEVQKVAFYKPFALADRLDVVLMILGSFGAMANGMSQPLLTVVFGKTIHSFSSSSQPNIVKEVSEVNSTPILNLLSCLMKELEFECVPTSLMEEVLNFLNDVREDLRSSMAKDAGTIKKESSKIGEELSDRNDSQLPSEIPLDFQKKITLAKHEKEDHNSCSLSGRNEVYEQLLEMEKEDELLVRSLQCRTLFRERVRASRQQLILVASLLDRIPNLAGLARTCEVFKASGLAISDKSVLHDKQFQLISVTAEKGVPIIEVPVDSVKHFLEKKKQEGYSILGLEQTANSVPLDQYSFPKKTVLVLGREYLDAG